MAIDEYPFGQPVRLRASFADSSGNAADPTLVELRLQPKWATDALLFPGTGLVDDPGLGNFSLVFVPDRAGDWKWEWKAEEPFGAVSVGVFHVIQRPVTA